MDPRDLCEDDTILPAKTDSGSRVEAECDPVLLLRSVRAVASTKSSCLCLIFRSLKEACVIRDQTKVSRARRKTNFKSPGGYFSLVLLKTVK